MRAIAFYLPQFHPIPENDAWWGKGYTEWRGVAAAKPLFQGHRQPAIPADLGFYDLRLPEARYEQASLARAFGIHGFCYYHYWFNGRRLLERPFAEVLSSGEPDLPFCVCWANESWTRRWDGRDEDVLIAQEYLPGWERRFIADLLPALCDPRYIRVNGRPLVLVYRTNSLPDARAAADIWREECMRLGIGEIYLAAVQAFALVDPTQFGFDAAVEFPLAGSRTLRYDPRQVPMLDPTFRGLLLDYRFHVNECLARETPRYCWFRGVMPRWDNTPRRGSSATVFVNDSVESYRMWCESSVRWTRVNRVGDEQLIFINAWNEWGEGAHLEPDTDSGHTYLAATKECLESQ